MTRVLLTGYSTDLAKIFNDLLPPRSLVILEERGIHERRGLSAAQPAACVEQVIFADYMQSQEYRAAVAAVAAERPFDAIFTGTEYTVRAAADLAEIYGLPGATRAAARCFTDKLELRAAATAGGVAGPRWAEVHGPGDLERFAASGNGDIVLKPADRAGSYGVRILRRDDDLTAAWQALSTGPADPMSCERPLRHRFMAEDRLLGTEVSVECLVQDGKVIFSNVTGKQLWPGSHPIERGHDVPGVHGPETEHALTEAMAGLIAATQFGTGILHGEWILTGRGPALVECAARAPGDNIVGLMNIAYGMDLVGLLLSMYLGLRDPPARPVTSTAIRFLHAAPGHVREVQGVTEAGQVPGVRSVVVAAREGTQVRPLESSWDRIGYVMAAGPDAGQAAERAIQMIKVVTG